MNRRGFLKACGLVAGAVLVVPSLRLIVPDQGLLPNEQWLATVRELYRYDLYSDMWLMRMDVLTGRQQFGVDCCIGAEFPTSEVLARVREPALQVLRDYLEHEGIALTDLRPPPIPDDYVAPQWAKAA